MKKLWGLIEYKPQWTLTVRGWLIILLMAAILGLLAVTQIHSFLAVNQPVKADALIVEGWMADEAIKGAVAEFARGSYKVLITTGLPISKGTYLSDYDNFAELTAATLVELGFDSDKIVVVATPNVKINRTAATAIAVRDWIRSSSLDIDAVNIYSFDVHTRRSWLLFQRVLQPKIRVGAIAYPSSDYDPEVWWTQSAGVRSIISETIAYIYSKFLTG